MSSLQLTVATNELDDITEKIVFVKGGSATAPPRPKKIGQTARSTFLLSCDGVVCPQRAAAELLTWTLFRVVCWLNYFVALSPPPGNTNLGPSDSPQVAGV